MGSDLRTTSQDLNGSRKKKGVLLLVEDYFSDQFPGCCWVFSEDITKKVSKIGLPNHCALAYIKMIDIWLLFNLTKPFVDILVTTCIDSLKSNESREINHHRETRCDGEEEED